MFISFQPWPQTQKDRQEEDGNNSRQARAGNPPVRASSQR